MSVVSPIFDGVVKKDVMVYCLGVGTSSSRPGTSKGLLITPRQGDTEVRLYWMLACIGNGKMKNLVSAN